MAFQILKSSDIFNISACENSLRQHNLFSSISVLYIVWGQYTVTSLLGVVT